MFFIDLPEYAITDLRTGQIEQLSANQWHTYWMGEADLSLSQQP